MSVLTPAHAIVRTCVFYMIPMITASCSCGRSTHMADEVRHITYGVLPTCDAWTNVRHHLTLRNRSSLFSLKRFRDDDASLRNSVRRSSGCVAFTYVCTCDPKYDAHDTKHDAAKILINSSRTWAMKHEAIKAASSGCMILKSLRVSGIEQV